MIGNSTILPSFVCNIDADQSVKTFVKEVEKKEPGKRLLKSLWNGILAMAPTIKDITSIVASVTKLL